MNRNYKKIVSNIFDACDKTVATADGQNAACTNTSDILTHLIQTVGKSVERWASDLFITWESIVEVMKTLSDGEIGESSIFAFGLRQDGVDDSTYIILRLMDTNPLTDPDKFDEIRKVYYRHIFALKIEKTENGLCMILKNIQDNITPSAVFGVENGEIVFS